MAAAADSRPAEQLTASRLSQRSGQTAALASASSVSLCTDTRPPSLQSPVLSEAKAQRVENGQVAAQHGEIDLQKDKTNPDRSILG